MTRKNTDEQNVLVACLGSADDPFPLELGGFEIEQQGQLEPRDGEISRHLSDVSVREGGHDFGIYDHQLVYD
jgi:hypothetical protein